MQPNVFELPEFGEFGVPGRTGALRAVIDFSVGGKLEDLHVGEAVGAGAFGDDFGGRVESLRTALAMEAGDAFEVALGDFAGEFVGEGGDGLFGEERGFLGGGGESRAEETYDDRNAGADAGHAASGGRGILAEIAKKNRSVIEV